MVKKFLVSLLAFCVLISGLWCVSALGEAVGSEETCLPAVGDKIGGFVVQSIEPMNVLGSTAVTFEHEKNGAKLLYLACNDQNVAFDITFKTPALDETGKAHVFEHMTICGSQKYADPNLFFPFVYQTYNTFVNAMTYHGMTSYPLSSLSEDQLMTMMDYYLSGVFDPLVATEPRMASREAWRYEMSDKDSPLTVSGTVYSEMQGALTVSQLSEANKMTTMFKDGLTAHVSGGRPEAIRTLTWEDLITFHDSYYHPSNSLMILYGKLDYEKFIRYIDSEYVSKFDRQDVYVERGQVEPYTETAYATYEAPVESTAQTENATYIQYSFSSNDVSMEDALALEYLANVISNSNSPVMRLLDERLPGVSCCVSVDVDAAAPTISFDATGANESDRDTFVQAVDEGLAKIAAEGLSQEDFDATLSTQKLNLMLTGEDSTLGVDASQNIALYWTYFDSLDYYSISERIANELTLEDMTRLFNVYLRDNSYRGVTVTKPVAGLAEENAAKLTDELAAKKDAMTDQEIEDMVAETANFNAWSSASPDSTLLGKLVNMTVEQLPETQPECDLADETVDGVRYLSTSADVSDLAQLSINLDVSTIPVDKLADAYVYVQLLGGIDTEKYSKEELETLVPLYLGAFIANISANRSYASSEEDHYCFRITTLGLAENAEKGYELLREILFKTDLTQITDIKNTLTESINNVQSALDDPLSIQMQRCSAVLSDTGAFNAYMCDVSLYDQLREMVALAQSDPAALTKRLEDARDLLLNRNHATVICAGSQEANVVFMKEVQKLLVEMPTREVPKADYSALRLHFASEAVVNNSTVHMNVLLANASDYSGKLIPIAALINDQYLVPQLRNAMGAYGANIGFGQFTDVLYTYRDPNLTETFKVFEALPEYLRTTEMTQAQVDNYIIGSYGSLVSADGKLSQALTALNYYWYGVSNEDRIEWMREAKSTTVADVHAAAEKVESMLATSVKSTSGTASSFEESKDMFDNVLKLEAK